MKNYSKQRETILEIIKDSYTHLTAEEIYERVIKKDSKISKSTVYRNINLLVENELIKRITIPNKPDKFDYFHQPHHHIICDKCGRILDFQYKFEQQKIAKSIQKQTGVESEVDSIIINGICKKCKSKNKKEEEF